MIGLAALGSLCGVCLPTFASQPYTVVVLPLPDGLDQAYSTGIVGGNGSGYGIGSAGQHATLWNGPSNAAIDLNPPGYVGSGANATDGNHQVGWGTAVSGGAIHAILWSGTSASYVDLNPASFTSSYGYGVGGGQAVGIGQPSDSSIRSGAVVWDLATGNAVILQPQLGAVTTLPPQQAYSQTWAYATDGSRQVGVGDVRGPLFMTYHALVWNGTAESLIDLNPPGAFESEAFGIAGDQIVGSVNHTAALWSVTDHTYVDLGGGSAVATNGVQQVGSSGNDAVVWSGTATSMLDLGQLLTPYFTGSRATGIDAQGNIIGFASGPNGTQAVMWIPLVPEPAAFSIGFGIVIAARRTRR